MDLTLEVVRFTLYHNEDGDAEKLSVSEGSTFNIENGVVTETKLDEKSVFNEKYSKNLRRKKIFYACTERGIHIRLAIHYKISL